MSNYITKPIPVRIPENYVKKLESIAKKLGKKRAQIIAFAALQFTQHAENNAKVTLPPDWREIFKGLAKASKRKAG